MLRATTKISYSFDALLLHLKLLNALGLWEMDWRKVAELSGVHEKQLGYAGLNEIHAALLPKFAEALNLPKDADFGDIGRALGLREGEGFAEAVSFFHNKVVMERTQQSPPQTSPAETMPLVGRRTEETVEEAALTITKE